MEKDNPTDLDILTGKIQLIAQRIKSDSNPEELDRLKKLIRKNVPFTLRGYFTAYLLREVMKRDEHPARKEKRENPRRREREERQFEKKNESAPRQPREERKEKREEAPRQPRVQREIPADARTLYINLGKIGKIYARNLIDLIMKDTDITKDDIYAVRVHDKYSFVTMSEENCNKAISALLGKEIRGRAIQINISNRDSRRNGSEAAEEVKEPAEVQEVPADEAVVSSEEVQEAVEKTEE